MQGYTYTKNEHYPMEHLVFKTAPEDVERFLEVDHEVWRRMHQVLIIFLFYTKRYG